MKKDRYTKTQRTTFPKRLKKAVKESKKSELAIANELGYNPRVFYAWSHGEYMPRMEALEDLCTYFGKSAAELLGSPLQEAVYGLLVKNKEVARGTFLELQEEAGFSEAALYSALYRDRLLVVGYKEIKIR